MTVKRYTKVRENDEGLYKNMEKCRGEIQRNKRILKWFKRIIKQRIWDLNRY